MPKVQRKRKIGWKRTTESMQKCWDARRKSGKDKWSDEQRKKFSISSNGKGKGWLSRRKSSLKRDNYTCQKCGFRDEEIMIVDHIQPRSVVSKDLRNELSNLQTLCPNCHARKTVREVGKLVKLKRWNKNA